jgi:hypothetical protein
MVPVKIDCACGWHYSFDAEPVRGRMASAVFCPGCGADVTAGANASISRYLAANRKPDEPVIIHPAKRELHIADPVRPVVVAPAPESGESPGGHNTEKALGYSARELGLVGREQAVVEARAKVSWGDTEETVIGYLMMQGYAVQEARELVAEMFRERRAATRGNGIRKIVIGICLMAVTVVTWGIFTHMDSISARLMARVLGAAVLIGLWGLWKFTNGLVLLLAPKLDHQDLAEQ